ncbi:MAG: ABC transporter ATP-binding protein [Acidobacteriota bacterium]
MAAITLDKVSKRYGSVVAVADVSLTIGDGEFVVLVGPSGCGKTTTLRMIAGLEPISEGHIKFDERIVDKLPPKDRDIAMVFQSYALYPHMTVADNMGFGLKMQKVAPAEIAQRVRDAAATLGLAQLLARKPKELSGGQRQRVAMGRALVRSPQAFLLDEPLSNLDAGLRAEMRVEIKKLHRRLGTTSVYVTHDQIEAMTLADRIVLMNHGRVQQMADPLTMYEAPRTKFVASFIGTPRMNFIAGTLLAEPSGQLAVQVTPVVRLPVPEHRRAAYQDYVGKPVEVGLRPENLRVGSGHPGAGSLEVVLDVVEPNGAESLAYFDLNGIAIAARCERSDLSLSGSRVTVVADVDHMHLIDPASDLVVPPGRPS